MSKKSKREKYIEDEEYKEVYDRATIFIKMCMEISYCCAARIDDVLNIKMSDLKEEKIIINHRSEKTIWAEKEED